MKWSLRIARLAGIDVFVHWTFALLLLWIASIYFFRGAEVWAAVQGILLVLAIFACVVLHELGHALTARRFGIGTRDITLLPIGGVARLERMPRDPMQELLVAIAGPAVNVVIAVALGAYLAIAVGFTRQMPESLFGGSLLFNLMLINIVLVVFNLLPAFPMDGGRVLRALLARRGDYVQATLTAARVGQVMAVLFAIAGLFFNPFLLFIALFVYLGAQGEARMVETQTILQGRTVAEAMMTRFRTLAPTDTLADAAHELLAGDQRDFPVVDEGRVVGLLSRDRLLEALQTAGDQRVVGEYTEKDVFTVEPQAELEQVADSMRERQIATVLVVDSAGGLIGIVNAENVGELLMIRSAERHDPVRPLENAETASSG